MRRGRERERNKEKKEKCTRNAIIGRRPEGANGIKPAFPYSWPISCVVLLLLPSPPSLWPRRVNETINLVCCVHTTCARTFISGRVIRPRHNRWAVCDTAAAVRAFIGPSRSSLFTFRSIDRMEKREIRMIVGCCKSSQIMRILRSCERNANFSYSTIEE